jgi:hypothetical protein
MQTVFRRLVIGSAVNMIPDAPGKTIRCTTTARSTAWWPNPFLAR